jgi:anti-sigma factor RsiW
MTHPSQTTLALYAGGDLGWFARRRMEHHLGSCPACRDEVEAFGFVRDDLVDANELPALAWNRLAAEMKANIRLGLVAGECVGSGEQPSSLDWLSGARAWVACASIVAVLAAGLFLQRPAPPLPTVAADSAVLRATRNSIELNQGGQVLSLLHVRAGDQVTYSAGAQGSMRARYVDPDTGNVTIDNLYVQ